MKKRILFVCMALLFAVALNQQLTITHYSIRSEKLAEEAVLVVLSDLHNTFYGKNQRQLADEIFSAAPNAVLMTGDMADHPSEMAGVRALVQALDGAFPLFYVSGNHESAADEAESIKTELRSLGVRVLEGESELLPCGIRIAGADDPLGLTPEEWRAQIDACRSADDIFTVLLSHRPDRVDFYRSGFDLVLSGHAHGGQVRIPLLLENGLWAPNQGLLPTYTTGMHPIGDGWMIVSRGLARSRIPRVFNRPELAVVHLQPQ